MLPKLPRFAVVMDPGFSIEQVPIGGGGGGGANIILQNFLKNCMKWRQYLSGHVSEAPPTSATESCSAIFPLCVQGVLVLLNFVRILVRLDCFSHSVTMEV